MEELLIGPVSGRRAVIDLDRLSHGRGGGTRWGLMALVLGVNYLVRSSSRSPGDFLLAGAPGNGPHAQPLELTGRLRKPGSQVAGLRANPREV